MRNPIVRLTACAVLLSAILPSGCSQDDPKSAVAPQTETGSLKMKLETTSDSGKVYRLRQAVLQVFPVSTGGNLITLRSEDDPTRAVLESFLAPGSYDMQLL